MVNEIKDAEFQEIISSDIPVLVDFWAPWCGPCKMLGPLIDMLSEEFDTKMKFCKMNVDENPETASKYGIVSIPSVLIFKNGELKDQSVGFKPKPALVAWIEENL